MTRSAQADLIRFLADEDLNHGVPLGQLPQGLLDPDLLAVASGDGLVEIGGCCKVPAWNRGELIEVERWSWRSATARGFKPLRVCLPDLITAGMYIRLTTKGQVEASRLAVAPLVSGGRKRGGKGKNTRKTDVAITLIVRHPELDDAAVARKAGCSRSLLSRNKDYQKNAEMARRAMARQSRHAGVDARTGEAFAYDEDPDLDC